MRTVAVRCPECNIMVPGPNEAQANRNLGLHRRSKHGYRSPTYERERAYREAAKRKKKPGGVPQSQLDNLAKARLARWSKHPAAPMSDEKKQRTIEYQRRYRARQRSAQASATPDAAIPCNLPGCPVCGSRFYVVRGQQSS
jgi:hypothetical protein